MVELCCQVYKYIPFVIYSRLVFPIRKCIKLKYKLKKKTT